MWFDLNGHRKPETRNRGKAKAAVNAPQSRRFAKFVDAGRARQRLPNNFATIKLDLKPVGLKTSEEEMLEKIHRKAEKMAFGC
ncbi:MAG: hypothetical protein ACLP2Y_14270 [Limisphaerales bacterium]